MKIHFPFNSLRERWTGASLREKRLMRSAAVLVSMTLVWWLLIAPPLLTFKQGQAEQHLLDAHWQKMLNLKTQAVALKALPKINREEVLRALEATVKQQLGTSAQLSVVGDSATLTLRNTPASALADWLPLARINARAIPGEARLMRSITTPSGQATWNGTIVLRLPPQ